MTVFATETFTGANGAAWPAQFTTYGTTGTGDIQGNRGRLQPPSSGYVNSPTKILTGAGAKTDSELYVEVTPTATLAETYVTIGLRSANQSADGAGYPTGGYFVQFYPAAGGSYELAKGSGDNAVAQPAFTYVSGATYGVRFQAIGKVVKSRVWNLANPEPTAWDATYTDTAAATAGYPFFCVTSGGGSNEAAYFDNIQYTDGALTLQSTGLARLAVGASRTTKTTRPKTGAAGLAIAAQHASASTRTKSSSAPFAVAASRSTTPGHSSAASALVAADATATASTTRSSSSAATPALTASSTTSSSRISAALAGLLASATSRSATSRSAASRAELAATARAVYTTERTSTGSAPLDARVDGSTATTRLSTRLARLFLSASASTSADLPHSTAGVARFTLGATSTTSSTRRRSALAGLALAASRTDTTSRSSASAARVGAGATSTASSSRISSALAALLVWASISRDAPISDADWTLEVLAPVSGASFDVELADPPSPLGPLTGYPLDHLEVSL